MVRRKNSGKREKEVQEGKKAGRDKMETRQREGGREAEAGWEKE